ncbi:hypothetical protein [Chthonobacter albigriseus]|uniref:hypothetical protein n=1 Tax=Chthonobacter albigriseus TaxID=1683161 RepID=UPI001FCE503B|nr:hypothetical protein [Chthonobacter albigriseus]
MKTLLFATALATGLLLTDAAWAEDQPACDGAASIGSGGSASAGGTSATTLGTGAACDTGEGTNATVGTGGSAAAADGSANSRSKVNANDNSLNAKSQAMAKDGGTWSKSKTQTKIRQGEDLASRTKSMSHVPGEKPVKSTTGVDSEVPTSGEATGATCDPATTAC